MLAVSATRLINARGVTSQQGKADALPLTMSSNRYVYGVVEKADFEFDADAVAGADRVYTVDYQSLSAVVSDIDTTDPERTDEDSKAHDEVLRQVLERDDVGAVVPMQFGMAFKDNRTLKSVLRSAMRAFRKALREVDGHVELGVKLVADEDADYSRDSIREDVGERLSALAESETEDDLFSDRLVLNRSYLVAMDDREAFDDAVADVREEYDDLTVQYTGPWAPYNFVDIHIGAQR
ncbi:Gas vesicle synthesis protein GvpL/GvpF [Haladaptatus litoreus]|uniref:Gas vesicle synthesis protein GvpL/GvpF n=2 Tax=Haladaptatus litoreus TaxID=553468 RepID=A0A1N6YIH7_9EURY|nr:GvpL/GvpF family gas vesicle protein [Haladaptatus litoreus]SIR14286.1 Gas vesicle synthesis protein GvpL/GvpF [Haladaptatus litoreus]